MCGINGIVGKINKQEAYDIVSKMNLAMIHRGPDDAGCYAEENIGLGHRRLSIIDLSSAGHQPMSIDNGELQIVFNGEIYNFEEVRNHLTQKGFTPEYKTKTDTEVLLYAYKYFGEKCLELLNGMFAFAIYNKRTNDIFIARDRMGIKPLYYSFVNGSLLFASEIRSIIASNIVDRKINHHALSDYIRYQTVHAPATMIENVYMLMPAHYFKLNLHACDKEYFKPIEYWKYNHQKISSTQNYGEACEQVKHLLEASVKRRLIADVPFGAFLSGGIDSSAIVGLMSKVSNQQVKTFSVTFEEEEFSEAKYARLIANKFNTDHTEIKLTPSDFMQQLPAALNSMDHPSGDGPNTFIVSKVTKQSGITMALSGLGGDEVFCGYDVFTRMKKIAEMKYIGATPSFLRKTAAYFIDNFGKTIATEKISELLSQDNFEFENVYPLTRQLVTESWLTKILSKDYIHENEVRKIVSTQSRWFDKNHLLSQTSWAEISTYMQNVLLRDTDQMSMAVALEVRVPFLDYTLIEYVMQLNDQIKFPHTPKKLLIDSLGDLLPSEIVNRKKMGFTLPWKQWMKNELKTMCEEHIYSLAKRNYFNSEAIISLWNKFLNDDAKTTWSRVWYLIVLENWLQENNIH
jgi:asparagine synthase (glutamine-hydrolysing)